MNTSSKVLLIITTIIIFSVVGFKFKQFYLDKNFIVSSEIPCDVATESCFTKECDVETLIVNCDGSPYKRVTLNAQGAPACLFEENCESFECAVGDDTCSMEYCSEDTLWEGESCVVPEETTVQDDVLLNASSSEEVDEVNIAQ